MQLDTHPRTTSTTTLMHPGLDVRFFFPSNGSKKGCEVGCKPGIQMIQWKINLSWRGAMISREVPGTASQLSERVRRLPPTPHRPPLHPACSLARSGGRTHAALRCFQIAAANRYLLPLPASQWGLPCRHRIPNAAEINILRLCGLSHWSLVAANAVQLALPTGLLSMQLGCKITPLKNSLPGLFALPSRPRWIRKIQEQWGGTSPAILIGTSPQLG